jgi:hypothetical protein
MPTHQSAASAINLVDKENEQAPRPIEAEALPGNAMDDAVCASLLGLSRPLAHGTSASRIKICMSAPTGCSSPHNMIDGAPQSKLGASAPIGCGSPYGETVGAPQSERRGAPHGKNGSIGACLLSTRRRSWVHVPSVPPLLLTSSG